MVESSTKEPIDNLLGMIEMVSDTKGKDKADELIEVVCEYINVKVHSFKTNYMNKRAFDSFKVRMAIPVAQNFISQL